MIVMNGRFMGFSIFLGANWRCFGPFGWEIHVCTTLRQLVVQKHPHLEIEVEAQGKARQGKKSIANLQREMMCSPVQVASRMWYEHVLNMFETCSTLVFSRFSSLFGTLIISKSKMGAGQNLWYHQAMSIVYRKTMRNKFKSIYFLLETMVSRVSTRLSHQNRVSGRGLGCQHWCSPKNLGMSRFLRKCRVPLSNLRAWSQNCVRLSEKMRPSYIYSHVPQ